MSASTPRRFPIRIKLILAFAVPVAILLVVTVSQILQVRKEARDVSEQAELALTVEGPGSLFDALHDERAATYYDLIDFDAVDVVDFPVYMDEARVITDESVAGFEDLLDGQSSSMRDLFAPALDALATMDDIRAEADAYSGPRDFAPEDFDAGRELFESYTAVIDQLIDATFEVTLSIEDPDLQAGAELTRIASRQADIISQITTYLIASLVNDDIISTHTVDLAALQGELNTNDNRARATAVGPYQGFLEHIEAGVDVPLFDEIVRDTLESGEYDVASAMDQRAEPEDWSYGNLRDDVAVVLQEQADQLKSEAADRERLYLALGLLGPLLTAAVTWLLSWSITRPLRSLTRQATSMADKELPAAVQHVLDTPPGQDVEVPHLDPVTVMTNDEVSDVAQALNTAQDSSLNLAVEQALLKRNIADSFVNFGQRNQQLLSRQLDFITELERNETDPNTLANLFRLDHLATRMRRNAESLLVLAGVDPPRKWAVPVSLADVIRAALSEVEDYQRVVVHDNSSVSVAGSAAADLTHLLAELLENALAFSLPIRSVEVHGGRSHAGYTLAIVDAGRGLNPDELDHANRRLAGTEPFTVAPSRFLGHYVVGTIAARHDITVELHSNPNAGITAMVALPSALLIHSQGEIQAGVVPQR